MTYPLTKREALSFLEDKLEIPNPEKLATEDRQLFLNTFVEQMKYKLPFTNIPEFTSEGNINVLSIHELKKAVVTMKGTSCIGLNAFAQALLNHFNFRSLGVWSSVYRWRNYIEDNHLAILVHDLTHPGSKHLIDVGSRYFLSPICLNFTRVSPTYTIRNIPYKFFNASPGVIHFCTKVKQPKTSPGDARLIYYEDEDCWEVLTVFRTTKLSHFPDILKGYHENVSNPDLLSKALQLFLLVGYPNRLMVNITQSRCTTITKEGHKDVTLIETKEHFMETVFKYFPQYTEEEINNAAKRYFK